MDAVARCENKIRKEYTQQSAPLDRQIGRLEIEIDKLQEICPHESAITAHGGLYWKCEDCGKVKDDTLPAHF